MYAGPLDIIFQNGQSCLHVGRLLTDVCCSISFLMEQCVICSKHANGLSQCHDPESWKRLYHAALIRKHKAILDLSNNEHEFPTTPVNYHRACRKQFVNKKDLQRFSDNVLDNGGNDLNQISNERRQSARQLAQKSTSAAVLPDHCMFCKREKYKVGSRTREKLCSVQEFRADMTVRKSASLHVEQNTTMSSAAQEIIGICSKDLISSEAKYHSSCYTAFTRILYSNYETKADQGTNNADEDRMTLVYDAVFRFCNNLISEPRVVEFREIRQVMSNKAVQLGISVPQSQYKNLLRMVSNRFPELVFIKYQQNRVLVYPHTLEMEKLVIDNYELRGKPEGSEQTII